MLGKVKSYSGTGRGNRGYGFITSPYVDSDIFFHYSNLETNVDVDDAVEFVLVPHEKGYRAERVRKT